MRSDSEPQPPSARTRAGVSRRAFLRRALLLLVAAPIARLGETVARADRRRRNHRGAAPDAVWIGHC